MKKNSLLIVISILWLSTANSCRRDDYHKTIHFINNSSKDVYIYSNSNSNYSDDFWIPGLLVFQASSWKVESNEKNSSGIYSQDCLEYHLSKKNVVVYVFDAEVLETVSRDTIIKYRMALEIYHPSLEEMEKSVWTIIYTGE